MIKNRMRDQPGPGDDLAGPLVDHPVTDDRQREPRVEELSVRGDQGEEQGTEGDEHEPVGERRSCSTAASGYGPRVSASRCRQRSRRMVTLGRRAGWPSLITPTMLATARAKSATPTTDDGQRQHDRDDPHVRPPRSGACVTDQ